MSQTWALPALSSHRVTNQKNIWWKFARSIILLKKCPLNLVPLQIYEVRWLWSKQASDWLICILLEANYFSLKKFVAYDFPNLNIPKSLLKSVSWFVTCYCLKTDSKVMKNSKLTKEQETFANWTVYFFLPSTFFLLWRNPISFQAL